MARDSNEALGSAPFSGGFSTWKMSCSSRFVGMNDRDPLVAWHAVCMYIYIYFCIIIILLVLLVYLLAVVWIAGVHGGATRVDTFHSGFFFPSLCFTTVDNDKTTANDRAMNNKNFRNTYFFSLLDYNVV